MGNDNVNATYSDDDNDSDNFDNDINSNDNGDGKYDDCSSNRSTRRSKKGKGGSGM